MRHSLFVPTLLQVRIRFCSPTATDKCLYFKQLRIHIQIITAAVGELMRRVHASEIVKLSLAMYNYIEQSPSSIA